MHISRLGMLNKFSFLNHSKNISTPGNMCSPSQSCCSVHYGHYVIHMKTEETEMWTILNWWIIMVTGVQYCD